MIKKQLMLDIETLGTKPGAVIIAIGACSFSFEEQMILDEFEVRIQPKSCTDVGLEADIKTVMWWFGQSKEAQNALLKTPQCTLFSALGKFTEYVGNVRKESFKSQIGVWGNDINFDLTLTEHAYDKCGMIVPWSFWESRSVRTLCALANDLKGFNHKKYKREGTYHSAVDDALHQARYCMEAWKQLHE